MIICLNYFPSDYILQLPLIVLNFFLFIIVPSNIRDLKIKLNNDGSITLMLEEPYATGGPDIIYVVMYGEKTIVTKNRTLIIPQPEEDTTYTFGVSYI